MAEGLNALANLGTRLVTLSNGSAQVAQRLLDGARVRHLFDRLLSVEEAGIWKPASGAYAYALTECGVDAKDAMLVAVHPWDIDGRRAPDSAQPGSTAPAAGTRRTSRRQTCPWPHCSTWPGRSPEACPGPDREVPARVWSHAGDGL